MSKIASSPPALLLVLGLALAAALPLQAESSPWYAPRLQALGFQVFKTPQPLPDFEAASLQGSKAKLSSLKGKIVLLNFWATWCPPCRAEMPSLETLWKASKDKPFTILGLSTGETPPTVAAFIAKYGYSYPIYLDPRGSIGSLYGVQGIPTTFVVGKNGLALAKAVGSLEYASPEALSIFAELAARGADGK
jgi:peroxiredoxin